MAAICAEYPVNHAAKSSMHRTVLLIDDSVATIERCKQALGQIRDVIYSVVHAPRVSDGLILIETERPDCTLIDWSVQAEGSSDVLQRVRIRYPFMPIIVLTDGDHSAPRLESMQHCIEGHVLKAGITPAALHSAIDSALRDGDARKTSARIAALTQAVLIIDDNADDREFCARALRYADKRYRIFEADCGDTGLAMIEDQRPDCVLLEYTLPGRSGLDVLRRIHGIDAFLPVIIMTGHGDAEIAVQAMKGGAQNYLVKSALTSPLLHQAVVHAVEHSELERQIADQREHIYEQKLALAETGRLTEAVLDSAPCLIVATDMSGKVLVFNKELERVLGYAEHEIVGKHTPLLWSPHSPILAKAKAMAEGAPPPGPGPERSQAEESTFIRKDGGEVPVSLWVRELRNSNGEVVGFVGLGEDITQRKAALEALRTSEETFRTAMEHAPSGMALIDPGGRFLKVNNRLCDILGLTEAHLRDTTIDALSKSDDVALFAQLQQQMLAGEMSSYSVEKCLMHSGGEPIDVQINMSLVRDTQQLPQYFITQIQDVSERKEVERLKRDFISIVSHELRTPITSIRGSLRLLANGSLQDRPEVAARMLDIANKNCESLILLVNDILDLDKMAAGEMRFDMKPTALAALVDDAVEAIRGYMGADRIRVKVQPISQEIAVSVDAGRLHQVLSNLISNAAKFSAPGDEIAIAATLRGGTVRLSVIDNGPGIPEAFRARLFEKFSQLDTSTTRKMCGSGLGLHISKQFIEHMGGQIGVDSTEGVGSTFWIELPAESSIPELVRVAAHQ